MENNLNIYGVDYNLFNFINLIEKLSIEDIKHNMLYYFRKNINQPTRDYLEKYFDQYTFWGSIHDKEGNHNLLNNRATALHEHYNDLYKTYYRLDDYRSKIIFYCVLINWYYFTSLASVTEKQFSQYFDLDIMKCDKDEVFVDVGAYTGDTILSYIRNYGADNYKKIYCYEITLSTIETMKKNLENYNNIIYRPYGASDKTSKLYFSANKDFSANTLSETGIEEIKTVRIDDDIEEPITFIKMDIEGGEQAALRGCINQIKNHKPKLAISIYHNNEDIWKIPQMIDDICPGYSFHIRYHGGSIFPTELTLLAVYQK
ncbi:FkbM family methyltransferase [Selenomonadales bacterium OttesenSCG-928-I06]|nr:FkbM family methyltransferase [Selenomonadales bacterium OttesenSCG-928-I06]